MKRFQDLLQDEQLCAQIEEAKDEDSIISLINEAAKSKDERFSRHWIADVIVDLKVARGPIAPTTSELAQLASTRLMSDTPPKLCHTDSCGGHPGTCC